MNLIERAKLRDFIIERLPPNGADVSFKDSDSLFMAGRLSSFDALELIIFLEGEFGADLAEIDFDQTQLDSVDAIAGLVDECRKQAART